MADHQCFPDVIASLADARSAMMPSPPDISTPQVILLGADSPIGLAMIRELGANGVRVHAIARQRQSLALYSRYVSSRHVRAVGSVALLAQLRALHVATDCTTVMTVAESDICLLHELRGQLQPLVALVPSAAAMARVLDKASTLAVARELGINTPQTWQWPDLAAMDRDLPALRFPVVLKWSHPARVQGALQRHGLPLEKLRYVYDAAELRALFTQLAPVGELPLVQRFYPGNGLGQMVLMHAGEPILRFQHRRLAEWPPEGGFSVVCESVGLDEHQALFEQSVELLRRLEFAGPAMVEYRYDADTGEAVLMEVNGRFWGSLPLACQAGAGFVWATYAVGALGAAPPPQPAYRVGLRCRYLIPEVKRLLRISFQPGAIQNRALRFHVVREWAGFIAAFFRPGTCYFVFRAADPLPLLADLWFALGRSWRR